MADKAKGVIVGGSNELWSSFQAGLSKMVEFVERYNDSSAAYKPVKDLKPDVVFIDLESDPKAGLALARRLKNSISGSAIFLVSSKKDPDVILEGLRIGVADYLLFPGQAKECGHFVQKALGKAEKGGHSGEITAVFSMKGGQGVTSIAVNLADHIHAMTKDRVILVDMNLFMGDVSTFLQLPSTYTQFDMLKDADRMDENLLFSSLSRHSRGFYILTPHDEVNDADQVSGEDISRILAILATYMDHIIIDLPHDFSEKSLVSIEAADALLLIVQPFIPAIKSVQSALKFFEDLGYDEKKIRVVLNRHMEKSELAPQDVAYVLHWPVFESIRNDFASLTDAINKGRTLDTAKPDTKINSDLKTLASRLTGIKPRKTSAPKTALEMVARFLPLFRKKASI